MKIMDVQVDLETTPCRVRFTREDGTVGVRHYNGTSQAARASEAMTSLIADEVTLTLREFCEQRWLKYHVSPGLAECTDRNYRCRLENHVLPHLGDMPITEVTEAAIHEYERAEIEAGRSYREIGDALRILSALLGKAEEWCYIDGSPMHKFDYFSLGTRFAA